MDKKAYVSQSQQLNETSGAASGVIFDDDVAEFPQNVNQIDFQTMKAANDTTKVREINPNLQLILFLYLINFNFC